jgi:hypothetical protein
MKMWLFSEQEAGILLAMAVVFFVIGVWRFRYE